MRFSFKATKIELSPEIRNLIEKESKNLELFVKRILKEDIKSSLIKKGKEKIELFLEVAKETRHHKKGPFFYTEFQLKFLNKIFRTESLKENLKSALFEARENLKRQLIEYKNKLIAKFKRKARKTKREIKSC